MHRVAALTALLSACTFTPNEAGTAPDAGPGGPGGTNPGSGTMPVTRDCHIQDLSLALCFDFEDSSLSPTVLDGSLRQHDATSSNVHAMARDSEQAAAITTSSQIYIAPSIDLSTFLTIAQEAWVRPDVIASGAWAINHQPQYGLAFDGSSALCQVGGSVAQVAYSTAPGTWTHVACVYDGENVKLYINGDVKACSGAPNSIDTGSWSTYIGPQLTGGIDNVRIFDSNLTDQEICDHAGQHDCSASCPG